METITFLEAIFDEGLIIHPADFSVVVPKSARERNTQPALSTSVLTMEAELDIVPSPIEQIQEDGIVLNILPIHKGGYKKSVLILLESDHLPLASLDELEFLGQIMKAVNLTSQDVALLNWSEERLTDWIEHNSPKLVISFADQSYEIVSQLPGFQVVAFFQGNALLLSSLKSLQSSVDLKRKVWSVVKDLTIE